MPAGPPLCASLAIPADPDNSEEWCVLVMPSLKQAKLGDTFHINDMEGNAMMVAHFTNPRSGIERSTSVQVAGQTSPSPAMECIELKSTLQDISSLVIAHAPKPNTGKQALIFDTYGQLFAWVTKDVEDGAEFYTVTSQRLPHESVPWTNRGVRRMAFTPSIFILGRTAGSS